MASTKTKLELTWIGKDQRPKLEPRILVEDPALSYCAKQRVSEEDMFDNVLVQGDNLLALKALEQQYTGKVKCIYIDPPYNSGSAFEHYDDGVEHSIWLSLVRERVELLWRLLSDDGSFWISIDDDEVAYLRVVLDEICGRRCFVACNVWQKRYSRENREAIGDVHEYVLVYAKNPLLFKTTRNKIGQTPAQTKVYRNPNNDPKGPWRPIPMTAQAGHATAEQFYEIIAPSGRAFRPTAGRCWGLAKATFEKMRMDGRIYFGKDGDSQPNVIRYLSEVDGVAPWTWWPHTEVGHTDEAKKEMHALFGRDDAFDTPKPERLIQRVIEIATNPGELVFDSFAGSGTTAAVAHKMGRRWVTIEVGQHAETLVAKRLRSVVDNEDPGGITDAAGWKGGGGFRFYHLAPSLLEKDKWGNWVVSKKYNPAQLAEAICKLHGFRFEPSPTVFWQQGRSTETDFLYVTTHTLLHEQLAALSTEVGPERTLLVVCSAYRGKGDAFPNLTVRKIPASVLASCEWGNDDYSLNVANVMREEPRAAEPAPKPAKGTKGKAPTSQMLPFGEGGKK